MTPKLRNQIEQDLFEHMVERILVVIRDSMDSAERVDVNTSSLEQAMMFFLVDMATKIAKEHGISKKDFLTYCLVLFNRRK